MNQFVNIPVLAANGAGAPVDVSKMGATKTIVVGSVVGGTTVTVEYATDTAGVGPWAPLPNGSFQGPGRVTFDFAAHWLRAVTSSYSSGTPNADCGASGDGATFVEVGAVSVEISALPALKTVVTSGAGILEVSQDGVSWSQAFAFQNAGGQTQRVYGQFARWTGGGTVWIGGAVSGDDNGPPAFSTGITIIYARMTGSDTSGNGTLANPYRTIQRASLDVPLSVPAGTRYKIDCSGVGGVKFTETLPTDYTLSPWAVAESYFFDFADPYFPLATGIAICATPQLVSLVPASDATINLADVTLNTPDPITGLRTLTIAPPRASWGVDGLKGKFVIDAANNQVNCVASGNTTTTISLNTQSTLTFPLRIMEPSAELTGSATNKATLASIGCGSIGFNGLKISTPGQPGLVVDNAGFACAQLCDLDSVGYADGDPARLNVLLACHVYGTTSLGSLNNLTCIRSLFDGAFLFGVLAFPAPTIPFFNACVFDACEPIETTDTGGAPSSPDNFNFNRCVVKNCANPDAAIFFHGNLGQFNRLDIYGNAGFGIWCSNGAGVLRFSRVVTSGPANGGPAGIFVGDGITVNVTPASLANPATRLKGVVDGMVVGDDPFGSPTRTWADFISGADGRPVLNEYDITTAAATGATGTGSKVIGVAG
jgi:hypothetical protein